MTEHNASKIVHTDLYEHPAYQAWRQLQNGHTKRERIEILKRRPKDRRKDFKKLVCRLVGLGTGGSNVVAKRCKQSSAEVEHIIYERILPQLPIPSLDYYGMVAEADSTFYWLFLEDAGRKLESAQLSKHRILIAHWLGQMHASSAQVAAASGLPEKGPNHYLQRFKLAREVILSHIAKHKTGRVRLHSLTAFLHLLQPLARLWGHLSFDLFSRRRRRLSRLAFPRLRISSMWSEHGQTPEARLVACRRSADV